MINAPQLSSATMDPTAVSPSPNQAMPGQRMPLSTATMQHPGRITSLDQLSQFVGQNGHKPLWVAPQLHDQLLAHYGADNTVVAHPMGAQAQQMGQSSEPPPASSGYGPNGEPIGGNYSPGASYDPAGNLSGNPPDQSNPFAGATASGSTGGTIGVTGAPGETGSNIGPSDNSSGGAGPGSPGGPVFGAHFGWGSSPGLNSSRFGIGESRASLRADAANPFGLTAPSPTGVDPAMWASIRRYGGAGGKGPLLL